MTARQGHLVSGTWHLEGAQLMARSATGDAGGRANEGGSVYRAGFGAYLIAYGLADREVWFDGQAGGIPHHIWFETTASVDDLTVQFSSDAQWHIQATGQCTWGTKFRSTIDQWVAAIRGSELGERDRVGLASGNLSQPLLDLRNGLVRVQQAGSPTSVERKALDRLRQTLPSATGWTRMKKSLCGQQSFT